MIISVSGKIGSGKDTVAKIIQEHTPYHNWEVKKFAGKLKVIATILTGIPIEKFEDQEFKHTILGPEWDYYHNTEKTQIVDGIAQNAKELRYMTVRDLLQKLGTEAMRMGLHEDTWVNALMSDYNAEESNWIITDTRFPNEMKAVESRKGIKIKVVRDSGNTIGTTHPSETALNDYSNWDYIIDNTGSIEDLQKKVKEILDKENLIRYASL